MYDFEDYGEQIREVDRALERECECMMERAGWLNGLKRLVKVMDDIIKENEQLKEEKEELRRRLEELCKASQPMGTIAIYNPTINGPLYGISDNDVVNLGGRANG